MRKQPILPPSTIATLQAIGSKLQAREKIQDVPRLATLLDELDPLYLGQAEVEIVEAAALYHWRHQPTILEKIFGSVISDIDQLSAVNGLEVIFIFHRDGRIREAALDKLSGPLSSAFLFASIAWRLNDWAAPVRKAAFACAARTFSITSPEVVARAAVTLLARQATWGRWSTEKSVLDEALIREDVQAALANLVSIGSTGPMASLLRNALRFESMDKHLAQIATEASQPSTRAVAFQTLIAGHAKWPSGREWRWIDKSMGLRRREIVLSRRTLAEAPDIVHWIRQGLDDRAVAVRKVAMNGLIENRSIFSNIRPLADQMLGDKSAAVRELAGFLVSRIVQEEASDNAFQKGAGSG